MELDLVLKNVRVVRPQGDGADDIDIGIKDGKISKLDTGNVVGAAKGKYVSRPSQRPG